MRSQFAPASALLVSLRSSHGIYLTTCGISYRKFSSSTRLSQLVSLTDFHETNVQIPIGSSGNISLNILQPITRPAFRRTNVILYLPPGPLFPNDKLDTITGFRNDTKNSAYSDPSPSPQHALSSSTLSTVVTVNYRLGQVEENGEQKRYYYPGPVHDTLAGFDWIFEHLKPKQLCVFGKHIGDLDLDLIHPTQLDRDSDSSDSEKPTRRRKALSRWPPYSFEYNDRPSVKSLGLWDGKPNLPHMQIFVHSNFSFEPVPELAPELRPKGKAEGEAFEISSQSGDGARNALSSRAGYVFKKVGVSGELGSDPLTEENASCFASPTMPPPRRPRPTRKRTLEADGETILARQGAEMVSLMRNACFWGREKGYAEERVKAVSIPLSLSSMAALGREGGGLVSRVKGPRGAEECVNQSSSVEEQTGRYFYNILEQVNRNE
ncbi:hypothetical protein I7I51_07105 [Histoplasma capsulatum]|uniref:Uncharacterized protein n=1 Tax=Ajellomyces capsulatus TaxID=5037 RepID=A0A8A1MHZ1_AJECA|nr:hypothetical protein I7I51_07105 [Histoplasma capsulatum]